jgi:AraC-like DNA-binding protein
MFPQLVRLGGYREFAGPDDLRGVVAALWSYSRPEGAPPIPGAGHRLPPDGDLSIAFWTQGGDARLMLIGPIATPRLFAPEPGLHIHAVRLHPEWSRDILGVDPREAVDGVLPFEDVSSRRLPHLLRRLANSATPLRDLLQEVRGMSGQASREARITGAALRCLRSSPARLESVAAALDVSERHLRRLIRQTAGFSPKHYQRMARLGRAIAAADGQPRPDWARIAADNDYCDQPHMIEEFRAMVGRTPAELFRERMSEISNLS